MQSFWYIYGKQILAMDINRENYELGLPIIQKAGVAHKIDFREGPALPLLDQMIQQVNIIEIARLIIWIYTLYNVVRYIMMLQGTYHGTFDFIFVDADKDNYLNYHKRLIDLVKIGGVIGYDNTLWAGSVVAPPDAPLRNYIRYYRDFVLEINKALAVDPRIEVCQLAVGDGITLCRRITWIKTPSPFTNLIYFTPSPKLWFWSTFLPINLKKNLCVHVYSVFIGSEQIWLVTLYSMKVYNL